MKAETTLRTDFYVLKIKEDLSKRQKANPRYSLRAYARHLGLHSATLSMVLKGQRSLPAKNITQVAQKLALAPKDQSLFFESFYKIKSKLDDIKVDLESDKRFLLDESYYKVIAEWEHYALLTLFDLSEFNPTIDQISERLTISTTRAEVVLNNLISSGLVKTDGAGKLVATHEQVRTTSDIKSSALRQSHLESLELAKKKLEDIEVALRDFSSTTVAIDLEKLPEAKTIIREFRQKMTALLRDGENKSEVYQLAIQFYPLTNLKSKKSNY
jgi:uncharacterized protein (TIGR02147 family)